MLARRFLFIAACTALLSTGAGSTLAAEASPNADEQCVMQCDEASDRCMAAAGGDEAKQQACDDAYSECLERCR